MRLFHKKTRSILFWIFAMFSINAIGEQATELPPAPTYKFKPKTLNVGEARFFKKPSDVLKDVNDGDTILIDPGIYEDCAIWRNHNLTLKANGSAPVILQNKSCGGKGIWVISGNNFVIEGISFKNAAVPDKNGAGIRAQGENLTIKRSRFINNENGILAGNAENGKIQIYDSYFEGNGKCEPSCAHGIYVNAVKELHVENTHFINQKIAHHVKSRALKTVLRHLKIEDTDIGTSSYLIDLPNGGDVLIEDCTLQKGPLSENKGTAISIGAEGKMHENESYIIRNIDFTNDTRPNVAFVRSYSDHDIIIEDIRYTGFETKELLKAPRK